MDALEKFTEMEPEAEITNLLDDVKRVGNALKVGDLVLAEIHLESAFDNLEDAKRSLIPVERELKAQMAASNV